MADARDSDETSVTSPSTADRPATPPGARRAARYVRVTPMKARRVVDLIRGLPRRRGAGRAAVRAAGRQRAGLQGARERGRQRRAQPRLDPRRPGRQRGLRRRGPDAQAVPPACPGPRLPDPQAHQPHHRRGASRARAPRRRPGTGRRPVPQEGHARREGPASGSEDQPARLPARHHHRLQVPLVRRQAVHGLRRGGRRDPQAAVQGHGAGRHLQGRDRAHP